MTRQYNQTGSATEGRVNQHITRNRMSKQTGFTMIELVVVIAIVGILAAVALPQFMNATKDAHQAAVKGTAGALAPAVMLARAQYEINRSGGTLGCETTSCQQNVRGFGGGLVDVNANGWPIGVSREITQALPRRCRSLLAMKCLRTFCKALPRQLVRQIPTIRRRSALRMPNVSLPTATMAVTTQLPTTPIPAQLPTPLTETKEAKNE